MEEIPVEDINLLTPILRKDSVEYKIFCERPNNQMKEANEIRDSLRLSGYEAFTKFEHNQKGRKVWKVFWRTQC